MTTKGEKTESKDPQPLSIALERVRRSGTPAMKRSAGSSEGMETHPKTMGSLRALEMALGIVWSKEEMAVWASTCRFKRPDLVAEAVAIVIERAKGTDFIRPGDLTAAYEEAIERDRWRRRNEPPATPLLGELPLPIEEARERARAIRESLKRRGSTHVEP